MLVSESIVTVFALASFKKTDNSFLVSDALIAPVISKVVESNLYPSFSTAVTVTSVCKPAFNDADNEEIFFNTLPSVALLNFDSNSVLTATKSALSLISPTASLTDSIVIGVSATFTVLLQ
ncbi:hypothetical protein [Mesoplasma melaleucae]|uniref:Uncharacterized protein n=1 Tax=Mesoplasma melaleucae TaxID=81459 RepID=A0A2K8NX80_9MOLU|nr:hypothetical protein [Mesoplasma melaleucae]ATZ18146.1 hypothetical protein EMELA_v1c06390 [Mesoplasma melaleucae]